MLYVYLRERPTASCRSASTAPPAADPNVADGTSRMVLAPGARPAANHNGGTLAFGPDGMLWFATGDGGGSNDQFGHAQDLGGQLSSASTRTLRRRTPCRRQPVGTAVWALGLRNPCRFSFDRRRATS